MHRRQFVRNSCLVCIGGFALSGLLESCASSTPINGTLTGENLIVPIAAFASGKSDNSFKSYVIVHHASLQFPICVYRVAADQYTALWMRCPHQGAELQVFGDKLQCPAHGSEFNANGEVNTPPAAENLRTFATRIEGAQLLIVLK